MSITSFLRLRCRPATALLLTALALAGCETSKKGFTETGVAEDDPEAAARRRKMESYSKQIARVAEDKVEYVVTRAQLAKGFIQQFNDGTVVDRVTIRKVQEEPTDPATYYVVGLGLRDGRFQAMAIPLQASSDNSLYLSSHAARYIITSVGCNSCFFNFEKNRITGTTCEENTGGSRCDLRVVDDNTFFPRTP